MKTIIYIPKKSTKAELDTLMEIMPSQEIIYYKVYEDREENFNYGIKHFSMYTKILNMCEDVKADHIYFLDNFEVPEYLEDELLVRPNFKTKISLFLNDNEENKYATRMHVIEKLKLNFSNIVEEIEWIKS